MYLNFIVLAISLAEPVDWTLTWDVFKLMPMCHTLEYDNIEH